MDKRHEQGNPGAGLQQTPALGLSLRMTHGTASKLHISTSSSINSSKWPGSPKPPPKLALNSRKFHGPLGENCHSIMAEPWSGASRRREALCPGLPGRGSELERASVAPLALIDSRELPKTGNFQQQKNEAQES